MEKNNLLEDVKLKMIDIERKSLLEKLDYIERLTSDIRPRITLPEFETYFMPFIIGLYERNENNNIAYLHNFLHITDGNPNLEIVVLDESDKEKYVIPPVMVSDVILGIDDMNGLNDVISFFLKSTENGPLAQAEANDILTKTINKLKEGLGFSDEAILKHLKDYSKIYNDYKHLLKDKDKYNNNADTSKTLIRDDDSGVDDLFDY